MNAFAMVISCEHAGNEIPNVLDGSLPKLFADAGDILASHRGWDAGALEAAQYFALRWNAPLFSTTISRLVCDTNRSWRHPALWSKWTNTLPLDHKKSIADHFYWPHLNALHNQIANYIVDNLTVLHLAIHSFTPVMNGKQRTMDIGLLYDPNREGERNIAALWQHEIMDDCCDWKVRRNAPYTGVADGLPTYLRRNFVPESYIGFEVEFNQALLDKGPFPAEPLASALERALTRA